jgi:hypothetical protein
MGESAEEDSYEPEVNLPPNLVHRFIEPDSSVNCLKDNSSKHSKNEWQLNSSHEFVRNYESGDVMQDNELKTKAMGYQAKETIG